MQHPKTWDEAKAWLDAGELERELAIAGWRRSVEIMPQSKLTDYRRKEPKRLDLFLVRQKDTGFGCFYQNRSAAEKYADERETTIHHMREVLPITDAQIEEMAKKAWDDDSYMEKWHQCEGELKLARIRVARSILRQTGQIE